MSDDENACVRNIVKEIMRESNSKRIKVNKNFVTYLTKILLIDPNWGIGDDFFNQRQNVQVFVKYVIDEILLKQELPGIVTLKIQFYFTCNLENMDYAIEASRKQLRNRLSSLKDNIYSVHKAVNKEDVDRLFKKIVCYITLLAGLGNPTKPKVFEEALIALKSVMNEEELREFVTLPKHEKHAILNLYTRVVAGVRLFNKDCDKGGEGIVNLPHLLTVAIGVIKDGSEQTLLAIMERVNALTTVVDKCYIIRSTHKGHQMKFELPEAVSKSLIDIERIKNMLIYFRQYELTIRKILEEIHRIYEKAAVIFANMEEMLKTIHSAVHMKIAIPVGVVFPLFEQLWGIWEQFQNQALLLSRLSTIMANLEPYAKLMHYDHNVIDAIIGDTPSMTDAERLAETAHFALTSQNPNISIIRSDSVKNIDNIDLEYLGFCCWKLIEMGGALIPGNPSMGIVVYKGRNYVFSCVEAFQEFSKDPQMYINCVLDLARKNPQLINFFQLKDDLESVYTIEKLVQSKVEIKMCEDKFIQTMSNVEESHTDPNYRWNIWVLKREALTMANISCAVTTSTQTDKTGSKNSIRSQTYYTKNVEVQTASETHTSIPKPSVFIYGLRGRKDNQQFKIDLTRPVDER